MLAVWLPLTKDLRNQGLANVSVTNNGATFNSAGKLGGCYNFTNQNIVVSSTSFKGEFTNNQASLTAWVKVTTSHSAYAQALVLGTQGTSWNNILFGIDINGSGTPIANASTGSAYTNLSFGTAIKDGVWHHIAYTYNAGTMKVYLDGVQKATTTTSNTPAWTSSTNLYIGGNSGGEKFQNGDSMNDVRVYNHCLSPMEVKELSKGLVLHYPLNRGGWGQENLIVTNSMAPTSGTSGWSLAGTGWANSNVTSANASNGHAIRCTYSGTTQVSGGIHHPTGVDKTTLTTGATYTVSARIRASKACIATFYNELMTTSHTINLTTDWKVYSYSCAIDTTRTYHSNVIYVRAADAEQNMWIECDWIKLEVGSIATPWCPNSSDALATTMGLNGTTEYDTSGFCNNGTRTGTFTWTSDTPKYNVSTKYTGSNYVYLTPPSTEVYTIALWAKWDTIPSDQSVIFVDNGSCMGLGLMSTGILCSTSEAGHSYTFSKSSLVADTWYHFVVVKTGTTTRKLYINGVEQTATTNTAHWAYSVNQLQLGKRSTTSDGFAGQLSDFRAYATALSASDVKSLYQNNAYIDSSGNVYGAIHSES